MILKNTANMDPYVTREEEVRKLKLRDFHKKVKIILNEDDRSFLYSSLKKYQAERKLDKLLSALKAILNTPSKLDLLKDIRSFIPPHQVAYFDEEVPYHNMARPWRARSMMNLNDGHYSLSRTPRSQPPSQHNTPSNRRKLSSSMVDIFQAREGPVVKVLNIYLTPGDSLGFSLRGGSEHGLGIFVSEVETNSAAERAGLILGDQIIEVNTISFDGIASSSAVKVLTGSDRLKVMVRRVGKVPGFKSTKEKIAWYDVVLRRLVRGDTAAQNTVQIPGTMGLAGHERKVNLNKVSRERPHLGFNIRGGAEFGLGIYISKTDHGGLAEENGLKAGDQLIEVNSHNISNKTHSEVVHMIKAQKSLILTVRDIGKFPAFKEIFAEYKWVDVNTGFITKTRSYKKHALETSGHIQSIPIRASHEDIIREQFSESRIDRLGDNDDDEAADSDGLDDVMMYLSNSPEHNLYHRLPLQEEKTLHSDYIRQPLSPKVKIRNGMTQSLDNIHAATTNNINLNMVVPVSPISRTSSERNLSMSLQNVNGHRMYTPNSRKRTPLWGGQYTDDEDDRLFYPRQKSAIENGMDFQSIHDIHVASTSYNQVVPFVPEHSGLDDSVLVPRHNSDIVMIEKVNDNVEEEVDRRNVKGKRDKTPPPRATLAVQALQKEARKEHPKLTAEVEQSIETKQRREDILNSLKGSRGDNHKTQEAHEIKDTNSETGSKGSKGSKSRSIRQFFFGSKSKEKRDSKKKYAKNRRPLSSINFDQDKNNTALYREVEQHAVGILAIDETAAVIRHLKEYEAGNLVSQLVSPLFAILDTTEKMKLCTHIRRLISDVDHRVFDDAVNRQFDYLEKNQKAANKSEYTITNASVSTIKGNNKPPTGNISPSKENKLHKQPTPKRVKRPAPLPPTAQRLSVCTTDGRDIGGQKQQLELSSSTGISKQQLSLLNKVDVQKRQSSNGNDASAQKEVSQLNSSDIQRQQLSFLNSSSSNSSGGIVNLSHSTQTDYSYKEPEDTISVTYNEKGVDKIEIITMSSINQDLEQDNKLNSPPPPPPPPPPLTVHVPSPRTRQKLQLVEHVSNASNNDDAIEGKSYRMISPEENKNQTGTNLRLSRHNLEVNQNKNSDALQSKNQNSTKSSRKRQGIYIESNSLTDNKMENNFSELANQKLEEYKQASRNGSRNSLNNLSDSEHDNKPKVNNSNDNTGYAKQSLMEELHLHISQIDSKTKRKIESQTTSTVKDDDRVSLSDSCYTAVGSVRRKLKGKERDMAQVDYMESADIFASPITVSHNGSPDISNVERSILENSQSDSVLQATNALAFLDDIECSDISHMDISSISRTNSHLSDVVTPRSDISERTSQYGSYDVNPDLSLSFTSPNQGANDNSNVFMSSILSSSGSTLSRRDPPVFIAPPPPEEPPPSDSDESYSDTSCQSGGSVLPNPSRSAIPNTSEYDTTSLRSYRKVHRQEENNSYFTNGSLLYNGHERSPDSSVNDSLHSTPLHNGSITSTKSSINQSDSSIVISPNKATQNEDTSDEIVQERKSWLYKKDKGSPISPLDSSTIGMSSGKATQGEIQTLFTEKETGENNSNTRIIYLDKSIRTMGLSISGGTDSKLQPAIRIKAVFPDGAAAAEGSLKAGMHILSIDDTSLMNATHMRAVVTIKRSFDNKSDPYMKMIISTDI